MRSVLDAEAEKDFADLLVATEREPVAIRAEDQELAVLLSVEEYQQLRQLRARRLRQVCEEASKEAQANGLTEEKLAEILADDE